MPENQKASVGIPKGHLVLLHHYPENHGKIQDRYKEQEFVR